MLQDQKVIVEEQPKPKSVFNRQLFGPFNLQDPKVQQQIVRTRATSGTTQRKFAATSPASPSITEKKTAITGGYEFAFRTVANAGGYNIYRSITNNAAIATLFQHKAQPSTPNPVQSLTIQDITATNYFYWVASVNNAGQEGIRIPVTSVGPPVNPSQPLPPGSGSGFGTGGGGGAANGRGRQYL